MDGLSVTHNQRQDDIDDFNTTYPNGWSCYCSTTHPPCGWCTHPGNPLGHDLEDDTLTTATLLEHIHD